MGNAPMKKSPFKSTHKSRKVTCEKCGETYDRFAVHCNLLSRLQHFERGLHRRKRDLRRLQGRLLYCLLPLFGSFLGYLERLHNTIESLSILNRKHEKRLTQPLASLNHIPQIFCLCRSILLPKSYSRHHTQQTCTQSAHVRRNASTTWSSLLRCHLLREKSQRLINQTGRSWTEQLLLKDLFRTEFLKC